MSKNINVNPGQYKVAGRERQGEDVVHAVEKQPRTGATEKRPAATPRPPSTRKRSPRR
jgi:hypothetical protein